LCNTETNLIGTTGAPGIGLMLPKFMLAIDEADVFGKLLDRPGK
jgi:hypothetical protein